MDPDPDVAAILSVVADRCRVDVGHLTSPGRPSRRLAALRGVARYVVAEMTGLSSREIGRQLGLAKSSVESSVHHTRTLVGRDKSLADLVAEVVSACLAAGVERRGRHPVGAPKGREVSVDTRRRIGDAVRYARRQGRPPMSENLAELYRVLSRKVGRTEARRLVVDQERIEARRANQ